MNHLHKLRWKSSCELRKISHAELNFLTIDIIHQDYSRLFKISRPDCEKGVLQNFANLTEEQLCRSLS